jgi:hypothetical protein
MFLGLTGIFTGDTSKIYDFETGLWNEPILKVMKNGGITKNP